MATGNFIGTGCNGASVHLVLYVQVWMPGQRDTEMGEYSRINFRCMMKHWEVDLVASRATRRHIPTAPGLVEDQPAVMFVRETV